MRRDQGYGSCFNVIIDHKHVVNDTRNIDPTNTLNIKIHPVKTLISLPR